MIPPKNENAGNTIPLSQLVGRDIHATLDQCPQENPTAPVKILIGIDQIFQKSAQENVDSVPSDYIQRVPEIVPIPISRTDLRKNLLRRLHLQQVEKIMQLTRRKLNI